MFILPILILLSRQIYVLAVYEEPMPHMSYEDRWAPEYQILEHPSVHNFFKMQAIWASIEDSEWRTHHHFLELQMEALMDADNEKEGEEKDKKKGGESSLASNHTGVQRPQGEILHEFFIVFKLKDGSQYRHGLLNRHFLEYIYAFQNKMTNTTEFKKYCQTVSLRDANCSRYSMDSIL